MSVEGLLSEASRLLSAGLSVRAADQAFFGGKQVFSDVSCKATCNKSKCSKETSEDSDLEFLTTSVQKAKNIVQDVAKWTKAQNGLTAEVNALKQENKEIKKELAELRALVEKLSVSAAKAAPASSAPAAAAPAEEKDDEDDFDVFGSEDEEDEEKKKVVEERLKAYAEKKTKKPGPIAKSSVILDVKPWDDETDLKEMEDLVRGIEMDGLVWGGGKLIAIGYGIKKLQIICVIEDLKVSVDDLIEKITTDFESHVQSVDIVAFNKI